MNKPGSGYFATIDYLRFVCAIAVVFFHLAYSSAYGGLSRIILVPDLTIPEGIWFRYGWVGVQIFFVISGFVIAESASAVSPWRFLRRRVERLYPAVWICAPLSALVWLVYGRDPGTTIVLLVKSLALLPGGEWIDAPYWTIGCEIGFYAVVFVVLVVAGGSRLPRLALILTGASALFWACFAAEKILGFRNPVTLLSGMKPIPVYYGMYFALGMLLYFRKTGRRVAGAIPALAACLVMACLETSLLLTNQSGPFLWPTLLTLAGVATIAVAKPSAQVNRVARLCGLATYPLYLIHFAAGHAVLQVLRGTGWPGFVLACLAAVAMVAAAILIAAVIEPWVRSGLRRAIDAIEPELMRRAPAWLFQARTAPSAIRD